MPLRHPISEKNTHTPSLRAQRGNPHPSKTKLDCFVAYAPRNDETDR
jgi:hypothetical protein